MTPPSSSPDSALLRVLGVWGLAASIVNLTIGAGIFRLPAGAAASLGAAAPLAYVVCAAAVGLIVLCFADAGSRVSSTGGPYAYVEAALGSFVGFVTGVLLWVGLTFVLAAVSAFLADSLAALVPALGTVGRRLTLVGVLTALAVANARAVRGVARFNVLMTVAKLLPLLLLIVAGSFAIRAENLRWSETPPAGAVARASLLLIFAFLGVESALVPSGEVRDPARTVPRAVFAAMAAVAVIYLAVQVVAQGVLGPSLAGDQTPLASAAGVAVGPWGRRLILVGSALSMFGSLSGLTLAVPRLLFAFARDGFLPARLAAVHPRWRTPYVAIAVQVAIAGALGLLGTFEALAVAANVSVLLVYAACCVAAAELRRRGVRAEGAAPPRLSGGGVVPWLALAVIVWLLWGMRPAEWLAAAVVVAVAVLLYLVTAPSRRARAAAAAAASPGAAARA